MKRIDIINTDDTIGVAVESTTLVAYIFESIIGVALIPVVILMGLFKVLVQGFYL